MSQDRSYYLGTHDAEIARLGLQHRVWRPYVLDAWRRAGVTTGSRVIDAGAGPGYASLDLAEIVETEGRVFALERSPRFIEALAETAAARGLSNIEAHAVDLVTDEIPIRSADAIWVRWVFAFLSDPIAVLKKLAASLRKGGVFIVYEYMDYGALDWTPKRPVLSAFVDVAIREWRASGGEPDIAGKLLCALPEAGLRLREKRPIIETIGPSDYMWRWPAAFIPNHARNLAKAGAISAAAAEAVVSEFAAAEADDNSLITAPLVMEIIAERV